MEQEVGGSSPLYHPKMSNTNKGSNLFIISLLFIFGFVLVILGIRASNVSKKNILGIESTYLAQKRDITNGSIEDEGTTIVYTPVPQPTTAKHDTPTDSPIEPTQDQPQSAPPTVASSPTTVVTEQIKPSSTPASARPATATPTPKVLNTPVQPSPTSPPAEPTKYVTPTPTNKPEDIKIYDVVQTVPIESYITDPTPTPAATKTNITPIFLSPTPALVVSTPIINEPTTVIEAPKLLPTEKIMPTPVEENIVTKEQNTIVRPVIKIDPMSSSADSVIENQKQNTISDTLLVSSADKQYVVPADINDLFVIENKDNIEVSLQDNAGNNIPLSTESLTALRQRLQIDNMNLFIAGENSIVLQTGAVAARTNLEIAVDQFNRIYVSNAGEWDRLATTPEEAVEYLDDINALTNVRTNVTDETSIAQLINLDIFDGEPAFEVSGTKLKFLLAFWPIQVERTVYTSVEDNVLLDVQQNQLNVFLDLLSL